MQAGWPSLEVDEDGVAYRVRVEIPADADPEQVHAECADGVLRLTLPKKDRPRTQKPEESDPFPAAYGAPFVLRGS
jgi:HSP20 family molecular chaperone IbpA